MKKKIIVPLIFAIIALAGIVQGGIMLMQPDRIVNATVTKLPLSKFEDNSWTKLNTGMLRAYSWEDSISITLPSEFAKLPLIVRVDYSLYSCSSASFLNPTHVIEDEVELSGVGSYDILDPRQPPERDIKLGAIDIAENSVSFRGRWYNMYTDHLIFYYGVLQVDNVWVRLDTRTLLEVNFMKPAAPGGAQIMSTVFLETSITQFLTDEQIPVYTDFIPSLYRFAGWRTLSGRGVGEAITVDTDFYPVMEKNFEYAGITGNSDVRLNNDNQPIAYEEGTYDNAALARDFASGGFKFPADASIQTTKDPILLTEFKISSMQIPWGKNETYFTLTLDVPRTDNFIPSAYNRKNLVLKSDNNYVYLMYGTKELYKWNFNDFIKQPQNDKNWKQNRITFTLAVNGNGMTEPLNLRWQLQYGQEINDNTQTYSGFLPDGVYRYDLNDNIGFLGMSGVKITRTSDYSYRWATYGDLDFLKIFPNYHYHYTPRIFPLISIKGCEAQIRTAVKCYVEGESSFTANLLVNHFEKPVLPAEIEKADSTIRWYLDSSYTQELLSNFHTARNYNELYGKWVLAEYDVTLVYYTVDRFRADLNGGKYYDALVKKTYTHTYTKGSVVNLNDYGADTYGVNFYDNIQQIKFQGWDKSITAPVIENVTITGQYKFPTATLRYYDVDDKLYGTVTQEMLMFPIDILLEEVKQANAEHPDWWLHEKPKDKGLLGRVYSFFESIARTIFGGDNVINGANSETREAQRKDTRHVIEQLESEHNTRNTYGVHRLYFLPVVYLDINLEQLNKGAYGNEAFNVREEDNPQWHLISGTPKLNNLVYYADVHNVYSLGSSNFTMAINFEKKMDGFDAMAKTVAGFFGWVGSFFGGIFKSFFSGFGVGGIWGVLLSIFVAFLFIALMGVIIAFIKSLFTIATHPVNKKAASLSTGGGSRKKNKRSKK